MSSEKQIQTNQEVLLALYQAISTGQFEIVQSLIENADAVTMTNNEGQNFFHLALKSGQYEIANFLIKRYPQLNVVDPTNGYTPLHYLAKDKKISKETLKTILESELFSKIDIDQPDKFGDTPLLLACDWINRAVADYCIQRGANINAKNINQYTILHYAAINHWNDLIPIALKNGVDIDLETGNSRTSPIEFAMFNQNAEAVKIFIKNGAKLKLTFSAGHSATLLHRAATYECDELAKHLVRENIFAVDVCSIEEKFPPLYTAIVHNKINSVKFLIDLGADINFPNDLKNTPLHIATSYNNQDIAKILINAGAKQTSMHKTI